MIKKIYSLFFGYWLLIIISTVFACSIADKDLSTPEQNIDTLYLAVEKKDFDLFSKCFHAKSDLYTKDNLKTLTSILFGKTVKITNHKIIGKRMINNAEAVLDIEETMIRNYDDYTSHCFKSKISVRLIRVGNNWKIMTSKKISLESTKTAVAPIKEKQKTKERESKDSGKDNEVAH